MAETLEKLKVWHKANALWDAVNAMLDRRGFQRDWKLHDQTADAIDSMVANIPEGNEQPTDRLFAKYLYTSKGSAAEAATRVATSDNRPRTKQATRPARRTTHGRATSRRAQRAGDQHGRDSSRATKAASETSRRLSRERSERLTDGERSEP